jgi:predicted RNA-binding protein YlxR (DUF448 family)
MARDSQQRLLRLRADDAGCVRQSGRSGTGRSAYVHLRGECVAALAKSRGIVRSLRLQLDRDARTDLVRRLEQSLGELAGSNA